MSLWRAQVSSADEPNRLQHETTRNVLLLWGLADQLALGICAQTKLSYQWLLQYHLWLMQPIWLLERKFGCLVSCNIETLLYGTCAGRQLLCWRYAKPCVTSIALLLYVLLLLLLVTLIC
jgi:hypothetical protein